MLHAINQGQTKAERNEDRFTSSIFQLLAYLPAELLFKILEKHLADSILKLESLNEISFEYWPKWDPTGVEENTKYVEPDVFIRTRDLDIIIEAKRFDERGQYQRQWEKEHISYLNEYCNEQNVIIWALGGVDSNQKKQLEFERGEVTVFTSTWLSLLSTLQDISYQQIATVDPHVQRLINDLFLSFELHGFLTGKWLSQEGFPTFQINSNSILTMLQWNPTE